MKDDLDLYKIMLELAEDENKELKDEIEALKNVIQAIKIYNSILEKKNKELVLEYDNLTQIDKRLN